MITEETMKHLTRVSPNNREARLALALHKRQARGKNHAYNIDPGMALAREICQRNNRQQIIGHITSIVEDDQGIVVKGVIDNPDHPAVKELILNSPKTLEILRIPDRTMPEINNRQGDKWEPPTTEMVLDAFDVWAKGVS